MNAFPVLTVEDGGFVLRSEGLTKREYFAAAALTGLCANPSYSAIPLEKLTADAFAHADAMIGEGEAGSTLRLPLIQCTVCGVDCSIGHHMHPSVIGGKALPWCPKCFAKLWPESA